ncbi:hypothetical protein BKA63DRAFT_512577 [Paraphoma chrysanthemicola]|nr:hypothetical protein BKA63DRAFT_512577 [Paraphoma chrysanthemicola]
MRRSTWILQMACGACSAYASSERAHSMCRSRCAESEQSMLELWRRNRSVSGKQIIATMTTIFERRCLASFVQLVLVVQA